MACLLKQETCRIGKLSHPLNNRRTNPADHDGEIGKQLRDWLTKLVCTHSEHKTKSVNQLVKSVKNWPNALPASPTYEGEVVVDVPH